jgi:cyclopropane-fatty-acyl-phospholipid synthase
MLDKQMAYSCGYWRDAGNLDEAQENKLDLICRKLGLQPGTKVLDIGCGWGSLAKYAAEKYKAEVVGITVSQEQVDLARKICGGLPVEIKLMDYRDIRGQFDRIVSVGMIEHVGYKNYRTFMEVTHRCLQGDGLFLLHTIGSNKSRTSVDPWINKYIFPNGMLPSIKQLGSAIEGLFVMEDWHNFSADYDKTLMAWDGRFEDSWEKLKSKYDEGFHRMWRYYLLSCAGSFRARKNQLWQIVLSKRGISGGYQSLR